MAEKPAPTPRRSSRLQKNPETSSQNLTASASTSSANEEHSSSTDSALKKKKKKRSSTLTAEHHEETSTSTSASDLIVQNGPEIHPVNPDLPAKLEEKEEAVSERKKKKKRASTLPVEKVLEEAITAVADSLQNVPVNQTGNQVSQKNMKEKESAAVSVPDMIVQNGPEIHPANPNLLEKSQGKEETVSERKKKKKRASTLPAEEVPEDAITSVYTDNLQNRPETQVSQENIKEKESADVSEPVITSRKFDQIQDSTLLNDKMVKYIPPEDQQPTSSSTSSSRWKKSASKSKESRFSLPMDVPMEDRLRAITKKQQKKQARQSTSGVPAGDVSLSSKIASLELPSSSSSSMPMPTNEEEGMEIGEEGGVDGEGGLIVLLTQGLHSGDKAKLDTVLGESELKLVKSTVQQLPVQLIIPLIKELYTRMRTKKDVRSVIRWLQCTLSVHMSYLTSVPDVEGEMRALEQWMSERVSSMDRLLMLQGRLQLLTEQSERRKNPLTALSQQPKLVYFEEESSSEESEEDEGETEENAASTSDDQATGGTRDLDDAWWGEQFPSGDEGEGEDEEESGEESEEDGEDEESSEEEYDSSEDELRKSTVKRRRKGSEESGEEVGGDTEQIGEFEEEEMEQG